MESEMVDFEAPEGEEENPMSSTSVLESITPDTSGRIIRKGRGHIQRDRNGAQYEDRGGSYESIEQHGHGPAKSVEGWIVFATNIHPEAQEDDILDKFSEYGEVKNIHVNLDRRTGFVKGYALIEFEKLEEGAKAIKNLNDQPILGEPIHVDWAFVKK